MTAPLTERYFLPIAAPISWNMLGETVTVPGLGGTAGFTLVSFLTAPLPVDSRLDYVLLCHEDADEFIWRFADPATKLVSKTDSGDTASWVTLPAAGTLETTVFVRKTGTTLATVSLTQQVVEPSADFRALATQLAIAGAGADYLFTLREICLELKPYIDAAATATGPNGIPARLLAAILYREAFNRPKDGSPKADAIRLRLEGKDYDPRQQALVEQLTRQTGRTVNLQHLHDIRDVEIAMMRGFFNEIEDLSSFDPRLLTLLYASRKTLGVGQIAQTTAAMVSGLITWRELTDPGKEAVLDAIEADYRALSTSDKLGIFNGLRFPKTNIQFAAQLLAKLKNRAHRFPMMSMRDVLASDQAIGMIATEYNRGGFDTPLASMKNNAYGDRAVTYAKADQDVLGLTRYFPDPP
ncbi:hypothetical protein LJR130_007090 [Variovorax sp. LjRoot130]|uniref:hypothetical protein n=1 Tax=Variovorax sp. LjRoot130 TaxID=3342261 RepID=UPI003ECFA040